MRFCLLFLVCAFVACTQPQNVQSKAEDTHVDSMLDRASVLLQTETDSAIMLSKKAIELAAAQNYLKGVATGYRYIGVAMNNLQQTDSAFHYLNLAIVNARASGDTSLIAKICSYTGDVYGTNGSNDSANHYLGTALRLFDFLSDSAGLSSTYQRIYQYNKRNGLDREAWDAASHALRYIPKSGEQGMLEYYRVTGSFYYSLGKYDSSVLFLNNALKLLKPKDKLARANIFNNLGIALTELGDYRKSTEHLRAALDLYRTIGDRSYAAICLFNIGTNYFSDAQWHQARFYFDSCIRDAHEISDYNLIHESYKNLYTIADTTGDKKAALQNFITATQYRDSVYDLGKQEKIMEMTKKYEDEKKKNLIQSQASELVVQRENKKFLIVLIILVVLITCIIVILILNRRSKERIRHEIEMDEMMREADNKELAAMLEGQSRERKRLSEDLHDRLGSILSTIRMHLSVLGSEPAKVEAIDKLVKESITELRKISHNLSDDILKSFDLETATMELAESIGKAKTLNMNFSISGEKYTIPILHEIEIFRTIQEIINNILKHAGATEVNIHFNYFANGLSVMIEDNGVGFVVAEKKQGLGLRNMRSRIERILGELTIDSSPGNGTTIIIEINREIS